MTGAGRLIFLCEPEFSEHDDDHKTRPGSCDVIPLEPGSCYFTSSSVRYPSGRLGEISAISYWKGLVAL